MQIAKPLRTVLLISWFVIVPLVASFGFLVIVLGLELVKTPAAPLYSPVVGKRELWELAGVLAAMLSAYVPLGILSRWYSLPTARRIMVGCLWPLPVIIFTAVTLFELR